MEQGDVGDGWGSGVSDHCADCGRELGLSGGRVDGQHICLDCCAVRARAKATPLDTGETLIVVTRSAYDLATLDTAYDLLRALVNEHRAARIAVLVRVGSRAVFDGVMLSTARETPNYGGKVRELASGYSARTAITLEVRLR